MLLKNASPALLKSRGLFLELWDATRLFDAIRSDGEAHHLNYDDILEAVWANRQNMPIVDPVIGDYLGRPVIHPADAHVDWWISSITNKASSGTSALLAPEPASTEKVLQWISTTPSDVECEVWYLYRGLYNEYARGFIDHEIRSDGHLIVWDRSHSPKQGKSITVSEIIDISALPSQ